MSEPTTTHEEIEITGDEPLYQFISLPVSNLPPGSLITITVRIGPEQAPPQPAAPEARRYMGVRPSINGGAA